MRRTVRYLEQWEKRRTMPLWREAFSEDTEEFLEYYYEEKTGDNGILVMEEDDGERTEAPKRIAERPGGREGENRRQEAEGQGEKEPARIVSMAHRNPYRLRLGGREADIDYIVAVATAEDRRHRGCMRRLLLRMMEDMHREKMAFCFLMPADPRIYEPFGFAFIYDQEHWQLTREAGESLVRKKVDMESAPLAARWMERWLGQRYQVYAVRDKRYVERLLLELASEDGWLEFLYDGENPAEGPVGIQGWWGTAKTQQRMLLCEERYREEGQGPRPAIMARIIDLKTCLELISLKKDSPLDRLEVILRVEDRECPWNQGTFLWKLDRRGSSVTAWEETRAGRAAETDTENNGLQERYDLAVSIEDLTRWIFGYGEPGEPPLCRESVPDGRARGGEKAAFTRLRQEIQVWERVFLDEIV